MLLGRAFQSGSDSHPVYVLMEVCKIVEGQRYPKLNDRQVTTMLEATCKRPQERDQNICIVGGRNTVLEGTLVCKGIPFVPEVSAITFVAAATPPPQPGEDSASSIAVVVPSMDCPEIYKYRCLVSAQPHRHEIIEDLFTVNKDPQKRHNVNGGMMRELLIPFRRKTNRRPERIIFHRDGTSEDQLSRVLLHELDTTNKVRASLEDVYLPPVTSVVVQKGHHLCSDDHCVCSVSVGSASYDAHVAMFCEHGYVDAESSDNGSAIGNTEQAAQEGSVEVRQLPEMRHTQRVRRKQMSYASVGVQMLGTVIPVPINEDASLEYVANEAMMKLNVKLTDVYFTCNGTIVSNGTQLRNGCRLLTHHRLRGGCPTSTPQRLQEKIEQLMRDRHWFHYVIIPCDMWHMGKTKRVAGLEEDARWILLQLLVCLERKHSSGLSLGGTFRIGDMLFDPVTQTISIEAKDGLQLSQSYYIQDLKCMVEVVIKRFFRYREEDGSLNYPMYVGNLVQRIANLMHSGEEYKSILARSMIFLHPCMRSVSDRLGIPLNLMVHYHLLNHFGKTNFRAAVAKCSSHFSWQSSLTRHGASPVAKNVLNFSTWDSKIKRHVPKIYPNDYFGRLDFTRCLITHARGFKVNEVVIDAFLFLSFEDQLLNLQKSILLSYKPSASISVAAVGGGCAATTSSGSRSLGRYIKINEIDERVAIDLWVVFGFIQKP